MKQIVAAALVSLAALGLAGCGSSESAKEGAAADTVEMPAEETMSTVDAAATPAPDAAASTDAATAAAASDAAATGDPAATKAAEDATAAAEKKM